MEPVVSFVHVTRRFGDRVVLEDSSFSIAEGERVGVLGPNGAGKTTLLRTLVGDELPEDGSVARKRGIVSGYVPQAPVFDLGATVHEIVAGGAPLLRALNEN